MTDELLLARLIARLQPRTDAVDAARRLLDIHGSLGPVLEADPRDLSRVGGLNPNAAQDVYKRQGVPAGLIARTLPDGGSASARRLAPAAGSLEGV